MVEQRFSPGAAESSHLDTKVGGRQTDRQRHWKWNLKAFPSSNTSLIRPHTSFLILPKQFYQPGDLVLKHEPMGSVLLQTITVSVLEILGEFNRKILGTLKLKFLLHWMELFS